MIISMGGSFAAAFSRDSDIASMTMNIQQDNLILTFFSSMWGDALLVISSALMLLGILFSRKTKLIPLAVSGILIMFSGMYLYYSLGLQIIGASIMGFAHLSNYNYKVSKMLKI